MTYHTALTATEYTKLRGATDTVPTYRGTQYLSLCPNTTIFAARVNQESFTASFAQVTYDTVTTGAYTDIQVGQTVYLSSTSDIRDAYFTGRVRKTPTSSVLYINETSAPATDNDYIFVIYDFRTWDKLAREVSEVQYKDFDISYRAIPPIIYGLDSAYIGIVSGTPTGFTVAFAAQAFAGTDGASISSYAYTIPSGATKTAGDENTANLTLRFDAGFYWVKLVVTDNGGRTATRQIPVWSVPADLSSQVARGFTGAAITHTADGPNASVNAFEGISDVLDNTLCCVWDVEYYNGTEGPVLNNVKFVGRLRRETDSGAGDLTYGYLTDTQFEIEGPGAQLQRLRAPLLALRNNGTPTVWDELKTLTSWRCIAHVLHEHSTFLTLHSLEFDSTANSYREKLIGTQSGNLLTTVNELAKGINARIEFNETGRAQVVRDARYQQTSDRAALTTIANWTTQDFLTLRLDIDHVPTVGRVEASGAYFNAYANIVTPLLSVAPGVAQASGERTAQLNSQVLLADSSSTVTQLELNQRSGHHYAASNPTDTLIVVHPDGYNFMTPSVGGWYTWTLDTSTNDRGRAYTTATRWLCTAATYTHDNDRGTKQCEATYSKETSGAVGQTVTYPPPGVVTPPAVTLPPLPPYENFPELTWVFTPDNPLDGELPPLTPPGVPLVTAPKDGNTVMIWTGTPSRVYLTKNFLKTVNPTWTDVSPATDKTIIAALFDPFGKGAYALAASSDSWVEETDFTVTDGAYVVDTTWTEPDKGVWVDGTGWTHEDTTEGPTKVRLINIGITIPSTNVTRIKITYDFTKGSYGVPSSNGLVLRFGGSTVDNMPFNTMVNGSDLTREWTGNATGTHITLFLRCHSDTSAHSGSCTLKSVTVVGTGENPFSSDTTYSVYYTADVFADSPTWSEGAAVSAGTIMRLGSTQGTVLVSNSSAGTVQYSDDYGATWTELALGGSGGSNGGGDVIPVGGVSLFAGSATIEKATTLGGAYSAEANGTLANGEGQLVKIPRLQFGSTSSKNTGTTPDYLLGATELTLGHALWRVTSSGKTGITPLLDLAYTPNGGEVATFDGRRIAVLLTNGTLKRLWTSINQGGAFTNRGNVSDSCEYLRMRRGDRTGQQLFLADGTVGPRYSGDFGATIVTKTYPSEGTLTASVQGIEPYG